MTGTLYNADNVVVGEAVLMMTPWVLGAVATQPADTVPLFSPANAGWASWVSAGATNEGFKVNVDTSVTQINIEEQSTPVGETVESKAIAIEASLAEDTLESMRLAWGGGVITAQAAGASPLWGKRTMSLTDTILYYTVVLEMRNFAGFARRIYVPKTSLTGSGEVSFRRASDKRMFPVRAASICKPSDIVITDLLAVPTS